MVVPRNKKPSAKSAPPVAKAKPSRKSLLSKVRPYILGLGLLGAASGIPQIHSGPKDQPRGWIEKIADKYGTKKATGDISETKNNLHTQVRESIQTFDEQLKNATPQDLLAQENRHKHIHGKYNLLYAQLEDEIDKERAKSAFNKKNLRFQTPESLAFGTGGALEDFRKTKNLLNTYNYRLKRAKLQQAIGEKEFNFESHAAGQSALKRIEQDKQNAISQGKTPVDVATAELKGISYYLQTNRFRDKGTKEPSKEEADAVRRVFDILVANPEGHSPDLALTALETARTRLSTYKLSNATKKFYSDTYDGLIGKIANKVRGELGAIQSVNSTPDGGLVIQLYKPPGFQFKAWKLRDHGGTREETVHYFYPVSLIPLFKSRTATTSSGKTISDANTNIPVPISENGKILISPDSIPDENGHSVISLQYGQEFGAPKGITILPSVLTHNGKFEPVVGRYDKNGNFIAANNPIGDLHNVLTTGAGVGTPGSNDFLQRLREVIDEENQKHPDKTIYTPMAPEEHAKFKAKYPALYRKALAAAKYVPGQATPAQVQARANEIYRDIASKFIVIKKEVSPDGKPRLVLQTNNTALAGSDVIDVPPELVNPGMETTEFGTPSDLSPDELKEIDDKPAPSNEQQGAPIQEQKPQEELPEMPHDINTNGDQDFQGKLDFRKANEWKKFASATEMRPRTAGVSPFSKFGEQLRRRKIT